ncbi:MAG: DJ-1/PfpI family protein [Oscillibacter sp.]|nr:DJ-1/PfpI family protein [Oscillibacter sp.]
MTKQVAVLAVNPVNGAGLFQYLETFFENKIPYKVFAVADSTAIRTNSGITLYADDIIAHLKGHADDYDALVFACGDAVPVFNDHAGETYNLDLLSVIKEFAEKHKIMAGHCAAGLIFEIAGITEGVKLAVHPMAKPAIQKGIATDKTAVTDGNLYTAQCEHTLPDLLPQLLKALQ